MVPRRKVVLAASECGGCRQVVPGGRRYRPARALEGDRGSTHRHGRVRDRTGWRKDHSGREGMGLQLLALVTGTLLSGRAAVIRLTCIRGPNKIKRVSIRPHADREVY